MCLILCFKYSARKMPEALHLRTVYFKARWLPQVVSQARSASSSHGGSRLQGLPSAVGFGTAK